MAYNPIQFEQGVSLPEFLQSFGAYFSPSWTAFQADGGRDFSVIVDGVSV